MAQFLIAVFLVLSIGGCSDSKSDKKSPTGPDDVSSSSESLSSFDPGTSAGNSSNTHSSANSSSGVYSSVEVSSSSAELWAGFVSPVGSTILFEDISLELGTTFIGAHPIYGWVRANSDIQSLSFGIKTAAGLSVSNSEMWVETDNWTQNIIPAILNSSNPDRKVLQLHDPENRATTDLQLRFDYQWDVVCNGDYLIEISVITATETALGELRFTIENALDDADPRCQ
jgi:hypothetical protein